jgi:hypothetical protein
LKSISRFFSEEVTKGTDACLGGPAGSSAIAVIKGGSFAAGCRGDGCSSKAASATTGAIEMRLGSQKCDGRSMEPREQSEDLENLPSMPLLVAHLIALAHNENCSASKASK